MTIHTVPFSIQSLLDADLRDMPRRARSTAEAVALVMPCYNEAKRLDAPRIVNFVIANPNVTLILVNDGSKDDTLSMALAMQALAPAQITVLDLAKNGGKAEAVRQGLCHALTTDAPLVAYWDADLATPLDAVEDFARVAQRDPSLEVIFGSRRQMLGHRIRRTLSRRVISRLCASMARMALGMPVADTQCGAKMLRATPALRAAVAAPFTAGWLFDVELFARLVKGRPEAAQGFYEFPLARWDEVAGSKVTSRAVLKSGLRMLSLILETRLGLSASAGLARVKSEAAALAQRHEGVARVFAAAPNGVQA